ncbi:hypothetical protein Tco_1172444 [Tanacetum coccineum]
MDATGGSGSNSPVWLIIGIPINTYSDDPADEDIAQFEVASKSKSSISKSKKVTSHKVVTQKVQTKAFPTKSLILIRNCILGLAADHTWAFISNKTFRTRKPKDAIVVDQDIKGKKKRRRLFKCEFVSLDPRLESRKSAMDNSFTLGSNKEVEHVKILQSCNGLLLCSGSGSPAFYYLYNLSTSLFKRLPKPENSYDDSHLHTTGDNQLTLYKFHIDDLDHPIITTLEIPNGLHQVRNFLQSFVNGSYDPMLEQIDIPGILHIQGRLFESRGCLLLVYRDDIDSREFTIYEMMKGCSMWMVRYIVNTDEFMTPLRERWSIQSTIFDIGSNQMDNDYEFFPPYTVARNPYEFILRKKIPNLDPPAGIFANHLRSLFECDFVSLDSRLNSKKSTMDHSFGYAEEVDHVKILQSCNGLLLCTGSAWPVFYYVYNPSTNLYKRLPQPNYYLRDDSCFYSSGVFRLAFDPRKSLHYKVMQTERASEGEEDAFVVINLSGKVVKYNLISKTNIEIFDIGSNQMDDDADEVEFITTFEVDPNLYEFIPSLASLMLRLTIVSLLCAIDWYQEGFRLSYLRCGLLDENMGDADVTRVITVLYVTLIKHLWCGNDEDERCVTWRGYPTGKTTTHAFALFVAILVAILLFRCDALLMSACSYTRRTVSLSDVGNTPESLFLYSGNSNVHELYDRIYEKLKKAVEELAVVK